MQFLDNLFEADAEEKKLPYLDYEEYKNRNLSILKQITAPIVPFEVLNLSKENSMSLKLNQFFKKYDKETINFWIVMCVALLFVSLVFSFKVVFVGLFGLFICWVIYINGFSLARKGLFTQIRRNMIPMQTFRKKLKNDSEKEYSHDSQYKLMTI